MDIKTGNSQTHNKGKDLSAARYDLIDLRGHHDRWGA